MIQKNFKEEAVIIEVEAQIDKNNAIQARICTSEDMESVFRLRHTVFVGEQKVDEKIERDDLDKTATHALCLYDGEPVGTGRMYIQNGIAHLGRVCVLKEYRNKGLGRIICTLLIEEAKRKRCDFVELSAQLHAVPFYKKLGFTAEGDFFYEAGIQHVKMLKRTAIIR